MGTDFLLSAGGGRLEFSDRRPFLTSLEEVNATLANIGSACAAAGDYYRCGPRVPGGGALTTFVSPHAYSYSQLFVVLDDVDYSRFDRFHVNVAHATLG
jgi:hypothetical protein